MNNESQNATHLPDAERPLPVITAVLLLAASALTSALSPLLIPLASAMTAFCMIKLRSPLVLLALLPAYPLALAFGFSWVAALISLAPVLPALVLAKTVRTQTRPVSVALTAAALGVFMLLLGALLLYLAAGQLSVAAVRDYLDAQTASLAETVTASLSLAAGENAALQDSAELVTAENVKSLLDAELPLLPGIFFAVLTAAAYISHLLVSGLHKLFGAEPLPDGARHMRMSVISAYVYAVFYLLVILLSSASTADSVIVIIGQNIITTLTLPFAIAGVGGIVARMKPSSGTLTPVVVGFIAVAVGLFNPPLLLSLAAFAGVIETFVAHYGSLNRHGE